MQTILDSKKMEVLEFFLDNPTTEVHLRGLSRKLNVSATWIATVLKEFAKERLLVVKKDKEKRLTLIKADRDSLNFKRLKISCNLYALYQSGLVDKLVKVYGRPECIVYFGSYAKGEDIEQSDIDMAVIGRKAVQNDWAKFEKILKRKVKVQELKRKINPEFMNTLANGIVVYGYLDVEK